MRKILILVALLALFAGLAEKHEEGTSRGISPASRAAAAENASDEAFAWAGNGPNPRFYEVAKKLDAGGDFYLYADVKDYLREFVDTVKPILMEPGMPVQAVMAGPAIEGAIDSLGLYGVEDFGMSGSQIGDLYRCKAFIRIPQDRKGLFKVMGPAPHRPEALDYAPADTLLFCTTDIDLGAALDLTRDVLTKTVGPMFLPVFEVQLQNAGTAVGANLETLIRSLGTNSTIIASLDPEETISISGSSGSTPFAAPAPRFALMVRTKDSQVYDTLERLLKSQQDFPVKDLGSDGIKKLLLEVPPNPDFTVTPTLAYDGQYVILASHTPYLDRLLRTKKSGENLAGQEEFKRLTRELPKESNGLTFQSKRIGEELGKILERAIAENSQNEAMSVPPESLSKLLTAGMGGMASVRTNGIDGISIVTNRPAAEGHSLLSGGAAPVVALAVAPAAILAAIAVPNFLEAQSRSKVARTMSDMRSLATAIESYGIDHGEYPPHATGAEGANSHLAPGSKAYSMPTFRHLTLTSPVAYILHIPQDVFAPDEGAALGYYRPDKKNYLIFGAGPDGEYDLDPAKDYVPDQGPTALPILMKTYDSTNGTTSRGDIFRTGGGY